MASPITLRVNGTEIVDFKSAQVTYGIESFARTFAFELSDKWLQTRIRDLPFAEGDPCEVRCHGEVVVDGFIDDLPIDYDATSHAIGVSGRSWNGHMVDCSAVYKGGSWRKAPLLGIAKDIAEPFGVTVQADPWAASDIVQPFERWAIEDEETAYNVIQRAAEMRGVFLTSNAGRGIVVTKTSPVVHPDVLALGVNVRRARRRSRFADRHSYYLVKAQRAGTDTFFADQVSGPFFRVDDPQVTAYRPLLIVSDGSGTKPELQTRASWERNLRAGRSRRITYDVHGHRSQAKRVWPVNERIQVADDLLDTREPLLIASVMLSYGPQGEVASLELCHPDAFDVLIPPKKPNKRKGFGSLL